MTNDEDRRGESPAVPLLQLAGISKRFGAVQALLAVDFRLLPGEIHALMGQNGAGKSTLIKVLTGVYRSDDGEMRLAGQRIRPASTLEAQHLGISTVYQEVNLCPNLSVAENIFAGRFPRKGLLGAWSIDWARVQEESRDLLQRLNLDIDVTQALSSFSVAVQQMVAIARGLSISAKVLILDEPTSSLDDDEVERLYRVLRQLRDQGMAILFVTHFLDQVYALCDRITVLRNGELVGEYPVAELGHNALIVAMVGRELQQEQKQEQKRQQEQDQDQDQDQDQEADRASATGAVGEAAAGPAGQAPAWLRATGLFRRGRLKPVDFAVARGEVVGVGGLLGSGRTELARLLFGLDRSDGGELVVDGHPVRMEAPSTAIRLGLGMCPEDRKAEGIIAELSVRENVALALQARQGLWPFISRSRQTELARHYVKALGIKTEDVDTPIGQLSGGNQQKVVLARWLATQPALLILDEPTRGIDVAAKQEIMNEILQLARQGMAVLFISSEMEEVVRVSDRIVVLRDRCMVGELPAGSSEQAVFAMIAGQA